MWLQYRFVIFLNSHFKICRADTHQKETKKKLCKSRDSFIAACHENRRASSGAFYWSEITLSSLCLLHIAVLRIIQFEPVLTGRISGASSQVKMFTSRKPRIVRGLSADGPRIIHGLIRGRPWTGAIRVSQKVSEQSFEPPPKLVCTGQRSGQRRLVDPRRLGTNGVVVASVPWGVHCGYAKCMETEFGG